MPAPGEGLALVVPCYDEAARFDPAPWLDALEAQPGLRLLFVDDGSRDRTRDVLDACVARAPERAAVLALPRNGGKAEAVRAGMLHLLDDPPAVVGFWDADLATPLDVVPLLLARLEDDVEIVLGARVKLLGHVVDRKPVRHQAGRVAATMASWLLRLPVYDTQCGAKLFRVTPHTRALFAEPFSTRWAFDVEILARWMGTHPEVDRAVIHRFLVEQPVSRWKDVPGSKVRLTDFLGAPLDLWRIRRRYAAALSAPGTAGRSG